MVSDLMTALYNSDLEQVKALLQNGADVNKPYNSNGWTPFMWACKEFCDLEELGLFLKFGGNVNSRNSDGETPFMIATRKRSSVDCLELLLNADSDINVQDKFGNTAVVNLINHPQFKMRLAVFDFLVENGADLDIKNNQGKCFWDYANEKELTEFVCNHLLEISDAE